MTNDVEKRIEAYLSRLRGRLRVVNREDVREIVEELHSHILDKAAASGAVTVAGVESVLAALGSPDELAKQYLTDELLARAEVGWSPVRIFKILYRRASLSLAGILALLVSVVGYLLGGVFILCAVLKPFHPQTTGLWVYPEGVDDYTISLRLGFGSVTTAGRELLGWWIVPIGLVAGCALVILTTRFALWCVRILPQIRRVNSGLIQPQQQG